MSNVLESFTQLPQGATVSYLAVLSLARDSSASAKRAIKTPGVNSRYFLVDSLGIAGEVRVESISQEQFENHVAAFVE